MTTHSITETKRGGTDGMYLVSLHEGADTQAADTNLVDSLEYWTEDHQGKGLAYVHVRTKYNRDNFSGIPQVTADIEGVKVKVWDGASWTVEWSDNPAWCIRDYLTTSRYGQGVDESLIDDDTFYSAAQYCDGVFASVEYVTPSLSAYGEAVDIRYNQGVKKLGTNSPAWDSVVASNETVGIDQAELFDFRYTIQLSDYSEHYYADRAGYDVLSRPPYRGGAKSAFGISTSQTSLDPATAELLIETTSVEHISSTTLYYTIKKSGTTVATSAIPVVPYSDFTSGEDKYVAMGKTPARITYQSGTAKFYIQNAAGTEQLVHTETVTLATGDYYSKAFLYDHLDIFKHQELVYPRIAIESMKGFRKRFTFDGVVNIENTPYRNITEMLSSCRGMLVFSGGLFKLLIDKKEPVTPAFTFDEDNIVGSWAIELGNKVNTFNRAKVHFLNKQRDYDADVLVLDNETIRNEEDNGLVLEKAVSLPFTTDPYSAQILGSMILNQSRGQIACTFVGTIAATEVEIGDIIYITHSTPGWTQKKFRVIKIDLLSSDEVGISALEYADAHYDFTTTLIEHDIASDSTLAVNMEAPTGFNVIVGNVKTEGQVVITWEAPPSVGSVSSYEIRIEGDGSGDNSTLILANTDQRRYSANGLPVGKYGVLISSVNSLGARSDVLVGHFDLEIPLVYRPSGLELDLGSEDGEANGTVWSGEDCKIKWRPSSVNYSYDINDEEPNGASSGGVDYYVKDFQVDVYNSSDELLRTEYVTDTWYIYTQEKNYEDAVKQGDSEAYRELSFKVWTRGYFGQLSDEAAIL
jgi:hypothetical protein